MPDEPIVVPESADSFNLSDGIEVDFSEKYWSASDSLSLSDAIAQGFLLFQLSRADTLALTDVGKKLMYPMKLEVFTKPQNLKMEL